MKSPFEGRVSRIAALALGVFVLVACAKKGDDGTAAGTAAESAAAAPAPADSTMAAAPASTPAATTTAVATGDVQADSITPAMVAEGDKIFHGQEGGGICFTCHGADAKGTQLAPPLVAHKWRTGDGSYAFLVKRITDGMPNPTPPYASPMPPMGGANLTPAQVKAVAAYVYSLSHKIK